MREDFLHYLWNHKKFNTFGLTTSNKETLQIVSSGQHNHNSGPDFFNAQLKIDNQLWAGNVEIHKKSSDWYVHNHEIDKAYDNVILHVVWEHDTDIYRKDNSQIPTLELKRYVSNAALSNYQKLFSKSQTWINCEQDFAGVDDFVIQNWLGRLYFERLERKSLEIETMLKDSGNNWEAVLFKMLAKNFGLKVNGEAFLSLASSFDFSVFRKLQPKLLSLEALLFGQAGLLESNIPEAYFTELKNEYQFLKQKFNLSNQGVQPLQFFRLRPLNFPTIRLAQLAGLYNKHQNLFSKLMEAHNVKDYYDLINTETSPYWENHYTFYNVSKKSKRSISKSFIDLLLVNTFIPLKFSFFKYNGQAIDDEIINLVQNISSEKNSIVEMFNGLRPISKSALHSQALIQLKNEYCDKNKCLQCAIGSLLLNRID